MARILRCPACGALWRLQGDAAGETLRCGECGNVFSTAKAETLEVDDALLEAKLESAAAAQALREAPKAAPVKREPARDHALDGVVLVATEKPRRGGFLVFLLVLLALVLLAAAGALWQHRLVLSKFPLMRPVYEEVCGRLPCPGFIWFQTNELSVLGNLKPAAAPAQAPAPAAPVDAVGLDSKILELQPVPQPEEAKAPPAPPVVTVVITNLSDRPQYLPSIEVRLLDPAGDTIVERLMEPSEYGFTMPGPFLGAGEHVSTDITVRTPIPYEPSGVAVKAVNPQL